MKSYNLLTFTESGLYCPAGNFYIDPSRAVDYAVITHAHSDHACRGHRHYLAHDLSGNVLRHRLGRAISLQTASYGEKVTRNGVTLSFAPAGHIIGSAQVKISFRGEVWVVSGDYKLEDDGLCAPFEPVKCHAFVSESTFGLPLYRWQAQERVFDEIHSWWKENRDAGKVSVLLAYSLGKAQRILHRLDPSAGPVFCHNTIEDTNAILRDSGVALPPAHRLNEPLRAGGLLLCPPNGLSVLNGIPAAVGSCSGWMALRNSRKWRGIDKGFVLSDHADWEGLNEAINATGAEKVFLGHGYSASLARYLREKGLNAREVHEIR
ncbi:putative mRNA 3-end processing factor [Anseongella ginsenosidimutans]|uniref:Putative mRNA 3-end processing factor n=1 Tax=Anseongella ginsenosidimutans TaxID=496056 RepID=A0A4R3KY24_9SPHI|nr:ligase-associated DNA damage response exonuclease [Anseongella ginsenosidimutans]QEC51557.1 ligase-associated DNA damage response exonuclease [Anseongella ginsenosidimutans]TCS88882.1 putative mRNA 3-end processing factor [Anseongella ginsenosidimutans]